ncbi:hypothetical protein [uncultured Lentilactobacillus sp.]|uniref:hypothetical protein n=1 Tax=uncultured Lentilactobacillus sp. TaxID=2805375 RepID=UPI0025983DB1|nr:hypothetical protein [uncultured Lentilactobacillus sp.]
MTNVFSYLNGAYEDGGRGAEAWYWIIGDYKLVYLWTGWYRTSKDFKADAAAMTVPDEIAPIHEVNIITSRDNFLINGYDRTNTFHVFKLDTSGGEASGVGSAMYIARK